jgi:hypothetical protein
MPAPAASVHEEAPHGAAAPAAAWETEAARPDRSRTRYILATALLGLGILAKLITAALDITEGARGHSWVAHAAWLLLTLAAYSVILGAIAVLVARASRSGTFSYLLFGCLWLLAGMLDLSVGLHTVSGARSAGGPAHGMAGSGDVRDLVGALRGGDPVSRCHACTRLGVMGPDAVAAVPALAEVLSKDESSLVRGKAAWALGRIGPEAAGATAALTAAASEDPDQSVRYEAAFALKQVRYVPGQIQKASSEDVDFSYPANWMLDVKKGAQGTSDASTVLALRTPLGSSLVVIVFASPADPKEWVTATSRSWGQLLGERSRTSFGRWGRYDGFGLHVKGDLFGRDGGIRGFAHSSSSKAFLVQEICSEDDLQAAQSGFGTVESSFLFRAP